ncbi:MAG TPA: class I SAM-dependent methyltransferase [Advenella sp.]|nr:class I SAM-dependent methyltransferase [Advenella sp.]
MLKDHSIRLQSHWNTVYRERGPDAVSWYRPHLDLSMQLLQEGGLDNDSRVVDVGGGASTLVDDILAFGVWDMTVVDLSETALEMSKTRLGADASKIQWIVDDITTLRLPEGRYTHWHDRAVFHFLTDPKDVQAYVRAVEYAVCSGGYLVIAGFAHEGPQRCSGLVVARRSAQDIADIFSKQFTLVTSKPEVHATPGAQVEQAFIYVLLQKHKVQG